MSSNERETVPGVLRGYRSWQLDGQLDGNVALLLPITGRRPVWRPGKNTAKCSYSGLGHPAPYAGCTCGLYAMHTPSRGIYNVPVVGTIKAYGKVILHEEGFRAEYAEIEGLILHPVSDTPLLRKVLRLFYQVPIFNSAAELMYHFPPISVEHLMPAPENWYRRNYPSLYPDLLRAEESSDG